MASTISLRIWVEWKLVGGLGIQILAYPIVSFSPFGISSSEPQSFSPYLPRSSQLKKLIRVKASTTSASERPAPSLTEDKNPLPVVLDVPRSLWKQTLRPLSNFGFGKKSIGEGSVGLFLALGAVIFVLCLAWLKGFQLRSRLKKYQAVFEFTQACGISTGTPVRIRGVTVGNVVCISPSLKSIEVEDEKTIIPQNSLIEVNQSGLLMETLIDITPQDPIPTPSVGPLDPDCINEGLIVCDRQKIKGQQGVSLDALVGICARLGCEMEEIGIARAFSLAEQLASVVEEAKPLLAKIEAMAEGIQPLLTEVRDSGVLRDIESLTKILTKATEDLRKVNSSVMTPDNIEYLRKCMHSLLFTLKNIESISSDMSGFTGDEATRQNMKLLIRSLSRLL